jgi:hypothetical protein
MQDWGVVISAAGLAILVLSSVAGLVWRLSRIEIALRAEYTGEIGEIRADHTREIGQIRADHSREIAALQAKVYEVEIWARDEFVRKGSFETVIARMERGFGDLRTEIGQRFDRISDSIEHIRQH